MTVSSSTDRASFSGNGVATAFSLPFRFFANNDVIAKAIDDATGVAISLTLGIDYFLTGAGEPEEAGAATGVLTTSGPVPVGVTLFVQRIIPATQPTDIVNQGRFFPEIHETVFDRLTMLVQQSAGALSRGLRVQDFDPVPARLPSAIQRANRILSFDEGGNPVAIDAAADSSLVLRQDLANSTDPAKGAAQIGYAGRSVADRLAEAINVKDFGAIGDGVADDTIAIQAALDEAASDPASSAYPYNCPPVWFPHGTYKTSAPLHATQALIIDGDNAIIKGVGAGFASKALPVVGGGTVESRAMLIFLIGNKNDLAGLVRWGAAIGNGITIDCNEFAYPGVYIERMCHANLNCNIQGSSVNGLEIGPYCWGLNLDEIIVENVTNYSIAFLENAAANGASIKNPRIWGEFKEGVAGIFFADGSECNGVAISGGFIEKQKYGVLAGSTTGPVNITGVDFEFCDFGAVRVAGDVVAGRKLGPINITNSFLHSVGGPTVYSNGAEITVEGCRFFPVAVHLECGPTIGSSITATNNFYGGGLNLVGSGISVDERLSGAPSRVESNYFGHKIAQVLPAYSLRNYQFGDSAFLRSSGLEFNSFYAGGASGQYVGQSEWFVSEYLHATSPGVLSKRIGIVLDGFAGANAVRPSSDGLTSLGSASNRWSQVFASSGVISTSDERDKQQVRDLSEAERSVALQLKGKIKAFKWNDAVNTKGDNARWHFGVMAQEVARTFAEYGLDVESYGMLCRDEWGACDAVLSESGEIEKQAVAAGERYGVRYEQLLAFIVAAL